MPTLVSHPDEVRVLSRRFGQDAAIIKKYIEFGGYKADQKAIAEGAEKMAAWIIDIMKVSDLRGGEILVEVVVDLDGGSPAAGADAFDLFQRKDAVSGRLFVSDAKLVLAVAENLVAAAQHAGDVGADLHVVLARRLGAQHGVVAEDVAHIELKQIEAL